MTDIGSIHCTEYEADASSVVVAETPGRVHYLGEHGEPHAGLFLSSGIDRYVRVAVSARQDSSLRFFASDTGERKRTTLLNLKYKREDRWANFIKMPLQMFLDEGYNSPGLNISFSGTIPQNIGLASSSALQVAAAVALRAFFHVRIDNQTLLAKLAKTHETFFGTRGAIVDYAIMLNAKENHFLIADEKTLNVQLVPVDFSRYKIVIMDSRVPRINVSEEIEERHCDIKTALNILSNKREGASFRDYLDNDRVSSMGSLLERMRRRSLHIVHELHRVLESEQVLKQRDWQAFSRIVNHSHESLRDLYEVSCPEIDWLVKRAQEIEGVLGSRMTGDGFGGCTYTILEDHARGEFDRKLEDYERIFGFHPIIYDVCPGLGARLVPR
ncbi:MAG: galactokinase [Treponema sp.]|jgi:galactokinase|nr:galactokinase [Treponema sp.]